MQLRQLRRLPGRYKEDSVPELPPKPTTLEPHIPFDPTLRPAAFPTLEFDQYYIEDIQKTEPQVPVTLENKVVGEPIMSHNIDEPGEFQPRISEEAQGQPTVDTAVSRLVEWKDLTSGLQLIVIRELRQYQPFHMIARFICLDVEEIEDYMNLVVREISIADDATARSVYAMERRVEMLLNGDGVRAQEEFDAFLDNESHNEAIPESVLLSNSETDVTNAKTFLLALRCLEDFPEYDPNLSTHDVRVEMDALLPGSTVLEVCARLDSYVGINLSHETFEVERDNHNSYLMEVNNIGGHDPADDYADDPAEDAVNPDGTPQLLEESASGQVRKRSAPVDNDIEDEGEETEQEELPPRKKTKKATKNALPKRITNKALILKKKVTKEERKEARERAKERAGVVFTQPPTKLREATQYEETPEPPSTPQRTRWTDLGPDAPDGVALDPPTMSPITPPRATGVVLDPPAWSPITPTRIIEDVETRATGVSSSGIGARVSFAESFYNGARNREYVSVYSRPPQAGASIEMSGGAQAGPARPTPFGARSTEDPTVFTFPYGSGVRAMSTSFEPMRTGSSRKKSKKKSGGSEGGRTMSISSQPPSTEFPAPAGPSTPKPKVASSIVPASLDPEKPLDTIEEEEEGGENGGNEMSLASASRKRARDALMSGGNGMNPPAAAPTMRLEGALVDNDNAMAPLAAAPRLRLEGDDLMIRDDDTPLLRCIKVTRIALERQRQDASRAPRMRPEGALVDNDSAVAPLAAAPRLRLEGDDLMIRDDDTPLLRCVKVTRIALERQRQDASRGT